MRPLLRLLNTRYGVALALTVLVLGVVGTFRGVAGNRAPTDYSPAIEPSQTISVEPDEVDDGIAYREGEASAGPSVSVDGATSGAVTATAKSFTMAWLTHTGVTNSAWLDKMKPHATAGLLARLKDVNPATVPAKQIIGDVTLTVRDPAFVEARVPLDDGTLVLRVLRVDGVWRVDGISSERSR